MSLAEHEPHLRVIWTDPVAGKTGYLVIHSLGPTGLCTGGTRMRAGCTMTEVEDLARGMALKTAVYGLPVGGAKGGIDCDPKDPQAKGVLSRFMAAMRPFLDKHWVTAEDLGVPQHLIDEIFVELGLDQSYHAAIGRSGNQSATLERVRAGLNAPVDGGLLLGDVVGGYGVAQSCLAVARAKGWKVEETTVAIQGIGTMGGGAAWYLHEAGMQVIEVADASGALWDTQKRLDIPALLEARNQYGEIDRSKVDKSVLRLDRDAILSVEADIFIPAATSYAITDYNVDEVCAAVIVEAANAATTHEAELDLAAKGICVIPDFVANAGAVTWAWWLLLGYVDDEPITTFDMLQREIGSRVESLVDVWEDQRIMPRISATALADKAASQGTAQAVHIP